MAVVVFDPAAFREMYPQFTEELLTDAQLQNAFDVACLCVDNSDASALPYDPDNQVYIRRTLLNLFVCHLASMALWPAGQSGPMSNATQGSVSVGFSVPTAVNGQYFSQTPCGQTFWQAIRPYLIGGRYYANKVIHPWG
jgi:hypothetical protein